MKPKNIRIALSLVSTFAAFLVAAMSACMLVVGQNNIATEALPVAILFLDISKTISSSNKDKGDDEDN